jgi:hypothetical protein
MDSIGHGVGFLATAFLLGAMIFFSVVIAPLIFIKLEPAVASRFIRELFPWYYLVIIVLSSLAAAAMLAASPGAAVTLAGVAVTAVAARQLLMPRINRARDAATGGEAAAKQRFSRLHRFSVVINGAQMVALSVVLASLLPASAGK